IAERDRQRISHVAGGAAEQRIASGRAGPEIAVGRGESKLNAAGELVVSDCSLKPAAAGPEEPAVPGRLGKPDLDADGGVRRRYQRCRDTTERWQAAKRLRRVAVGDDEDPGGVVLRRRDDGVLELQGLQVGARGRRRRSYSDHDRRAQAGRYAKQMPMTH